MNEEQRAVVAITVDPAHQRYRLTCVFAAQLAAGMSAFRLS
jgi:hypothetical protein